MRARVVRFVVVAALLAPVSSCAALARLCGTCCLSCANGGGPVPEDQRLPEAALPLRLPDGPTTTTATVPY